VSTVREYISEREIINTEEYDDGHNRKIVEPEFAFIKFIDRT